MIVVHTVGEHAFFMKCKFLLMYRSSGILAKFAFHKCHQPGFASWPEILQTLPWFC